MRNNRRADAIAAYQAALKTREQLASEFPNVPRHQFELARVLSSLAGAEYSSGEQEQALAHYHRAIDCREAMRIERPDEMENILRLTRDYLSLGIIHNVEQSPRDALHWLDKATDTALGLSEDDADPRLRETLRRIYTARAFACRDLGRHDDEFDAWGAAVEYGEGPFLPLLKAARSVARARTGDHAAAEAEVRSVLAAPRVSPPLLYETARALAICAAVVDDDTALTAERRVVLGGEYAASAVALLQRANEAGHFENPELAAELRNSPDFAPLRARTEFVELLMRLNREDDRG